jgi:hypothetical protein
LRSKIGIGIEIAIENRCQTNVSRADFDPDSDSDFEFGWNLKVELILKNENFCRYAQKNFAACGPDDAFNTVSFTVSTEEENVAFVIRYKAKVNN